MTVKALEQLFISGDTIPAEQALAVRFASWLVWESGGTRFVISKGRCYARGMNSFVPEDSIRLAHPIEMDADEILCWRSYFDERGIEQPFCQMREAIVLSDGALAGNTSLCESAGTQYPMLDRYEGLELSESSFKLLSGAGFSMVVRDEYQTRRVKTAHIVTPFGVLYNCEPFQKDTRVRHSIYKIKLGKLMLFENVKLRTLNHAACVLERLLLPEMILHGRLELILPHIECADAEELRRIYAMSKNFEPGRRAVEFVAEERGLNLC